MKGSGKFWATVIRFRWVLVWTIVAAGFACLLWPLRHSDFQADPLMGRYLQLAGSLLAFTFAANALVRFRGMHDRLSLILAFGFGLSGLIEAGATLTSPLSSSVLTGAALAVPLSWMVGRTLLAVVLVAALLVERNIPTARDPNREITWTLLLVGVVTYLTSAVFFAVPVALAIFPQALLPRPWDLLPAGIFLIAAVGFWRRLARADSALDRALFLSATVDVACHVAMTQSRGPMDAAAVTAQFLELLAYAIVLGGALLDNARLFDQVSRLATSDPLTGLGNYRRLIEVMEAELERANHTGRGFAVLLLDLDGLKRINDSHGHLVGSQAPKRLAQVLRIHCRAMDTAARYGGDEFALVLPEAAEDAARQVAERIRKRLAEDGHLPRLSVSVGVGIYPRDGVTIERLLNSADRDLYAMKTKQISRGYVRGRLNLLAEARGKGEWRWEAEEKRKGIG